MLGVKKKRPVEKGKIIKQEVELGINREIRHIETEAQEEV